MISAFKKMLDNWVNFEGRTTRHDYWWATLGTVIFEAIVAVLITVIAIVGFDQESAALTILAVLLVIAISIFAIFLAIAGISMAIRRIRDAGFPWWFYFANFIPSVGQIIVLVLLCFPTSEEPVINVGNVVNTVKENNPQSAPKAEPKPAAAPVVDVSPEEAPVVETWKCPNCNAENEGNFCASCGTKKP